MRQPVLKTRRLVLRPFRPSDAGDVRRLAGDAAIADTTLNIPHPYGEGVAEAWIARHGPEFRAGRLANFAITLRSTGELIGAIGLTIAAGHGRAELGYWVGKPHWNEGYCTEAAEAVLGYAFTSLKLRRVFASHLARNPASGRVMDKLGMVREGLLRCHVKKGRRLEDVVYRGMLNADWRRRAAGRKDDAHPRRGR